MNSEFKVEASLILNGKRFRDRCAVHGEAAASLLLAEEVVRFMRRTHPIINEEKAQKTIDWVMDAVSDQQCSVQLVEALHGEQGTHVIRGVRYALRYVSRRTKVA